MKRSRPGSLVLLVTAALVGAAVAGPFNAGSTDGWSREEIALLSTLRLNRLGPVPRDPSNAYETSPGAVELGKRIFSDPRFSANGKISCASCHLPDKQFQDSVPLATGIGTGKRRTMPLSGLGHGAFYFWDGRKDSLWSQALGPLEDAAEHGGNRVRYARVIERQYRGEYETLFGPLPDLSRLPSDAGPLGTPVERDAWQGIDGPSRQQVSRVFANIGKALAAYEKTLNYRESRVDRYIETLVNGDPSARTLLDAEEKNGMRVFIGKGQCVSCHGGPLFTDHSFHNTGVPPRPGSKGDPGRRAAIPGLLGDEFNCMGPFSDAGQGQCEELRFIAEDDPAMEGAFKTPSLRGVAGRAPYMHAGQIPTLHDAVQHYNSAPRAPVGHTELKTLHLSDREVQELTALLRAM